MGTGDSAISLPGPTTSERGGKDNDLKFFALCLSSFLFLVSEFAICRIKCRLYG
ncbi:hypothetical protein K435DRAFT_773833, partial [Dendrothele bispora CBS 962.96]